MRSFKQTIFCSISTLLLMTSMCAQAETKANKAVKAAKAPASSSVAPSPQQQPPILLNDIARTAAKYGVKDCLPRISQVTNFLVGPAQNGAVLFLSPENTNKTLEGLSLEVISEGVVSYVSTSFSPGPGADQCSATYDTVTYWPSPCEDLATRVFTGFRRTKPLYQYVIALEDGPLVRVFLMRAGSGCVSIKKETIYP